MRRLGVIDGSLLVGLGVLWCVCFGLHLQRLHAGDLAWLPVYVSAAEHPAAFPTVVGFWGGAERGGLAPGDRLLEVGGVSLEGAGRLRFVAEAYAASEAGSLALRAERDGAIEEAELRLLPVNHPWRTTPVAVALAAIGALVLWRGRRARVARLLFGACMASSFYWLYFFGAPAAAQNGAAVLVFGLATTLACPLIVATFLSFPAETAPLWRRWRGAPWLLAPVGVLVTTWAFGLPLPGPLGAALAGAGNALFLASLLGVLAVDYRRSGPRGRRQLKWVFFGLGVAAVPPLLAAGVLVARPESWWLFELAQISWVAVPLCVFMAIEFFEAFDIDRLISVAATYTLFLVVGLTALLTAVPAAAAALQDTLGVDAGVGQLALGLGVAGVLVPAARSLRPRLERFLFPERFALEAGAAALRADLGRCKKGEELLEMLGTRLDGLLEPECLAIYGRVDEGFQPVFARGSAVAPAFAGNGRLITWMELEATPLRVAKLAAARGGRGLAPLEAGALEAMGVELVAPLFHGGELAAFLCLGAKRSGDVYTPTDEALLATLTDKASDCLTGFSAEELRRADRARAEESLRFVPGAIAGHVERGVAWSEGERQVTVMFVDVRGYTAFAEGRRPEQIFERIRAHTRAVSEIVVRNRGFEVDFVGDGLMFAFGAVGEGDGKESAALRAAREIAAAMAGGRAGESPEPILPAGIGVATGPAYLGIIETDRKNFAVLGNTTNLAARLEALTRELDAAVVVDAATARAAEPALLRSFEPRSGVPVRGRSDAIDLHAYPLAEANAARA